MARFCIVAPPVILKALKEDNLLGHYHLLLAHDVVQHPKEYGALFGNPSQSEKDRRYIVLDNSIIELGKAVDLHIIKEAASIVQPTCVVLPDVMLDASKTITSCMDALSTWGAALEPVKNGYRFMMVPQGGTFEEFAWCAETFADQPEIGVWGIPRNLVKWFGTRKDAIAICRILNRTRIIHMLGFSDNMWDDAICAQDPFVYAIDSAVPLRVHSDFRLASTFEPRGNWWDTAEYHHRVPVNLERARKYFSYKG